MLIEELFASGVMTMGPSRTDPARQVGVFRPEALSGLPALRAAEIEKFRWIAGEWDHENRVPATPRNPAYVDDGVSRFAVSDDSWICAVLPDGSLVRQITFDPFSRQWFYVLTRGSYGMLRSPRGWEGNQLRFTGRMTMIGIECEWRMTWTREGDDAFRFVNEELAGDGSWAYIDEWQFRRR